MADRLIKTPTADMTWFLQCAYCKTTNMGHETELLDKARKLCKNHKTNHFLDYVTAELDTLDHAILTPTSEIEILTQIHNSLPCSCLTELSSEIEDRTQLTSNSYNVTIPAPQIISAIPQSSTKPTPRTTPKKPAKTLLERLKNGSNGTHQPRKI